MMESSCTELHVAGAARGIYLVEGAADCGGERLVLLADVLVRLGEQVLTCRTPSLAHSSDTGSADKQARVRRCGHLPRPLTPHHRSLGRR
jgi:hypothetical protein